MPAFPFLDADVSMCASKPVCWQNPMLPHRAAPVNQLATNSSRPLPIGRGTAYKGVPRPFFHSPPRRAPATSEYADYLPIRASPHSLRFGLLLRRNSLGNIAREPLPFREHLHGQFCTGRHSHSGSFNFGFIFCIGTFAHFQNKSQRKKEKKINPRPHFFAPWPRAC